MAYKYSGEQTIEQQLATAAAAKEEAKQRIAERRAQLRKLRNDHRQLEELNQHEQRLKRQINELATATPTLPEPKYGGPKGLRAAAEELRQYNRSRNSRTSPEHQDAA